MKNIAILHLGSFLIMLAVLTTTSGCKKDSSPAIGTEEVSGYIHLYDESETRLADHSGIKVSIKGDTTSTITSVKGNWRLSHLFTGTYTFTFSKPGYGTMKAMGKKVAGGFQLFDTISMYPLPKYGFTMTKFYSEPDCGFIFGYFSNPFPANGPCFHFFFNNKPDVSSQPGKYMYDWGTNMKECIPNIECELAFNDDFLLPHGFKPGDTVYVIGYTDFILTSDVFPMRTNNYVYYTDENGNNYFPNLGATPTQIMSFVMQ
jgi:hypothetical protein